MVRSVYVSGANPPVAGQTTRISSTWQVRNTGNVALDFNGTIECPLGADVSDVSAMVTAGTAAVVGRTAVWDGFTLGPGDSASVTLVTDVTPSTGTSGGGVVIVEGVFVSSTAPGGGLVRTAGAALNTTEVSGLANGGLVTASAAPVPVVPAAPAPVAPAPAAPAAVQPVGVGAPAGTQLPRTGTGLDADTEITGAPWPLAGLALLAAGGVTAAVLRRRFDSRNRARA